MTDFLERLPWRLASLAALVVGAARLSAGTESWVCLQWAGVAFLIFGGLGLALRALMRGPVSGTQPPAAPPAQGPGSHVDQSTPEMTVDDL